MAISKTDFQLEGLVAYEKSRYLYSIHVHLSHCFSLLLELMGRNSAWAEPLTGVYMRVRGQADQSCPFVTTVTGTLHN